MIFCNASFLNFYANFLYELYIVDVLTIRVCVFFVLNSPVHLNERGTFIIYRAAIEAAHALHQCAR